MYFYYNKSYPMKQNHVYIITYFIFYRLQLKEKIKKLFSKCNFPHI